MHVSVEFILLTMVKAKWYNMCGSSHQTVIVLTCLISYYGNSCPTYAKGSIHISYTYSYLHGHILPIVGSLHTKLDLPRYPHILPISGFLKYKAGYLHITVLPILRVLVSVLLHQSVSSFTYQSCHTCTMRSISSEATIAHTFWVYTNGITVALFIMCTVICNMQGSHTNMKFIMSKFVQQWFTGYMHIK